MMWSFSNTLRARGQKAVCPARWDAPNHIRMAGREMLNEVPWTEVIGCNSVD